MLSSFRLRSYKPLGSFPVARTDRHFSEERIPGALFVIAFEQYSIGDIL